MRHQTRKECFVFSFWSNMSTSDFVARQYLPQSCYFDTENSQGTVWEVLPHPVILLTTIPCNIPCLFTYSNKFKILKKSFNQNWKKILFMIRCTISFKSDTRSEKYMENVDGIMIGKF